MPVEVATHVSGRASTSSTAPRSRSTMSFDVAKHKHVPLEIYGEAGTLIVPDPNYFGGKIEFAAPGEDWREEPLRHAYHDGNYRSLGLADMAQAIRAGRPHRASGALALHVLEVMEAFQTSSDRGAASRSSRGPSGLRRCRRRSASASLIEPTNRRETTPCAKR